ncbi:helix-turn-helix domain-containing protein [Tepidibacillus marianensis]|uniref:helix-turn-helix domain-containing protein n=1 Tax=Tepidibacillus marianensis TaxID=3131995 RepID=UPI0030D58FA3
MDNQLGNLLRDLRGKMSLREASEKSGLSHTYIRDLELGMNRSTKAPIKPSVDVLKRLASAYDYPFENILKAAGILEEYKPTDDLDEEIKKLLNNPENGVFFKDYLSAPEEKKKQLRDFMKFLLEQEKDRKPGDPQK